jgi:hypothetical protein
MDSTDPIREFNPQLESALRHSWYPFSNHFASYQSWLKSAGKYELRTNARAIEIRGRQHGA